MALPPLKAPEKLPITAHLSLVKDTDKSLTVICTRMQGDKVLARKVVSEAFARPDEALDEFKRIADRVFYFGEADLFCGVPA